MREIIPNKDDMTIAKLLTHGGKNVTLYCVAKNPVLFEFDQYLIPTGRQRLYIKSAVIKFVNFVINVFSCFIIVYVFLFSLYVVETSEFASCTYNMASSVAKNFTGSR